MMRTIPTLAPINAKPRRLNERLWQLIAKETAGTATARERAELDVICARLEAAAA